MKYCSNCGYKLSDTVNEEKTIVESTPEATETEDGGILEGYSSGTPVARPGIYDWRKMLDEKRATLAKNSVLRQIPQQDAELSKFGDLVIGEGIQQVL